MKPFAAALTIRKNPSPFSLHTLFLLLAFMAFAQMAFSQSGGNYTSKADGNWTSTSTWNPSSNFPATTGSSYGAIVVQNNVTAPTLDLQIGSLTISAGKTLTVNGNFSISNGTTVNVSGTLHITGNATLNATLNILPGGKVVVDGSVTVVNSTYLNVGTNAAPGNPAKYADLVIQGDLISKSSGDITVNQNGRVAIFGNVKNDNSGGTLITINNGGQVYVDKNVALVGGGDKIVNNNTKNPWGLYVNGSTTVDGANGSTASSNNANQATLIATNDPFWQWVNGNANTPLPIKLAIFKVSSIDNSGISLTWTTTTEINFDKFIIEHSTNGIDFESIGEQKSLANNTSTITTYTFIHTTPMVGRNYYRLKSVDLDTKYEYSAIIQGEYTGGKAITLYPNPTADRYINLSINFAPSEGDHVSIFDMYGTLLQQNTITELDNQIDFTNNLKPGTYILKYASATGNNHTLRFVVR